jgi:pimeloyl-ACP methyl ester carboxylesterase
MTETWVDGSSGRLHVCAVHGGGLPVVFVHGLTGDVSSWAAQLEQMRQAGRRAVAIDLRGHGRSDAARDGDYSLDAFVSDVAAVTDALAVERFVLVGHSFGAAVAGEYAGRHAERVAALVLVDPAGDLTRLPPEAVDGFLTALRSDAWRDLMEGQFEQGLVHAEPAVRERVLANMRAAPRDLIVGAYEGMLYNPVPAVERYRAAGGFALTVTADTNAGPLALHELVPDLPRRTVTGTSHWLHLDHPDAFNGVLEDVLADAH